jgi:hypothetical protein
VYNPPAAHAGAEALRRFRLDLWQFNRPFDISLAISAGEFLYRTPRIAHFWTTIRPCSWSVCSRKSMRGKGFNDQRGFTSHRIFIHDAVRAG